MTTKETAGLRRIFVTRRLPEAVADLVAAHFQLTYPGGDASLSGEDIVSGSRGSEVLLVTATDRIDASLIDRLSASIKVIATYSVGYDHIDLDRAREKGIAVFHTPDVLTEAVAETGMLLLLGAARRVTESVALIRSGNWQGWSPCQLNGTELNGKRLGILGMGRIGRAIADRARAFRMMIHYANRSRLAPELEGDAIYHANPEEMLKVAQFLMIACPSTPETRGFLNSERLALLPRGAIVANVSRGDIVIDQDLVAALETGHVTAAGLDVFDGEPNIYPRYFDLPNVFMLPHIGSSAVETREQMGRLLVEGIRAYGAGAEAPNRVV